MDCTKEHEEIARLKKELSELKTQYKHLEQEQHQLDAMYQLFNKHSITSETDLNGIITYVSKPFLDISGYKETELLGQPHNIVRHPDMPKEAFKDMWETIQAKKVWQGEVKNRKKDGGYYWVESIVFPIFDHNNTVTGYKSIRVDITQKKKVHDVLDDLMNLEESIF